MLALLQRVSAAQVTVNQKIVGSIQAGLLVFLGVEKDDDREKCEKLAQRVMDYRIFPDDNDQMNRSVKDVYGSILVVSQFTLAADTKKGLRPSFSTAALPEVAQPLYEQFVQFIKNAGVNAATGEFGAHMQVTLSNEGPVTFLLKV